jgi:hypothetical protein
VESIFPEALVLDETSRGYMHALSHNRSDPHAVERRQILQPALHGTSPRVRGHPASTVFNRIASCKSPPTGPRLRPGQSQPSSSVDISSYRQSHEWILFGALRRWRAASTNSRSAAFAVISELPSRGGCRGAEESSIRLLLYADRESVSITSRCVRLAILSTEAAANFSSWRRSTFGRGEHHE